MSPLLTRILNIGITDRPPQTPRTQYPFRTTTSSIIPVKSAYASATHLGFWLWEECLVIIFSTLLILFLDLCLGPFFLDSMSTKLFSHCSHELEGQRII